MLKLVIPIMCVQIVFHSLHLGEKEMNLPSPPTVISLTSIFLLGLVTAANAESWEMSYCYIMDL